MRRLSSISDPESRPVFVSLYADLSDPQHEAQLERRSKDVKNGLPAELQDMFEAAWAQARTAFHEEAKRGGTRGVAVFSAPEHDLLEALGLAQPVPTSLVVDSSPYVRPLAGYLHYHDAFVLVLLDTEDAAIFLFDAAEGEMVSTSDTQPIGSHKSGGMSQARYQRHREGVVNQFLDEVLGLAQKVLDEGDAKRVILAGPGQGKTKLLERAPQAFQDAVIAVEDADFKNNADDPVLAQRFVEVATRETRKQAEATIEEIQAALKTDGKVAVGPHDCIQAALAGQVRILVVLRGHRVPARRCEEHSIVFKTNEKCPTCGAHGNTVDAVNEAVEFAIQNRSEIRFVSDDAFLESVGGIAALLRF